MLLHTLLMASNPIAPPIDTTPDDSVLRVKIRRELVSDEYVSDALRVVVDDGTVTLQGPARHLLAKERAERLTRNVDGVDDVIDRQYVVPAGDGGIESDLRGILSRDPAIAAEDLRVSSRDGHVHLIGFVDTWADLHIVETAAKLTRGVHKVTKEISIRDVEVRDRALRIDVEAMHRWNLDLEHEGIRVRVTHGTVELTGVVPTPKQKILARIEAYRAGAEYVEDSGLVVGQRLRPEGVPMAPGAGIVPARRAGAALQRDA